MAAVPQTTLSWLWNVLTKNHHDPNQTYRDPDRTYHDIVRALAQYPSFGPRTDVYTYENGSSSLLLHIAGTLPVSFRGTVYKFPIDVWIPSVYPLAPPIVYVTPTPEMVVRVGQHVTLEGRIYHHYLAHWAEAWDRSSLVDLFAVLREVFAKEPPVKYKNAPTQQPAQTTRIQSAPPPVPPLPAELSSSPTQTAPAPAQQSGPPRPPQLPPKPGQSPQVELRQATSPGSAHTSAPPLPALPPKNRDAQRQSYYQPHQNGPIDSYTPQRSSSLRNVAPPAQALSAQPSSIPGHRQAFGHFDTAGPVSPLQPASTPIHRVPQNASYEPRPDQDPRYTPGPYAQVPAPTHQQRHPYQDANPQQYPPQRGHYRQSSQQVPQSAIAAPVQAPRRETPDLLTSPFDLELPSIAPTGPPPPVPPNPEKDALLHTLSRTLTETLQSNVSQSKSATLPLQSQSQALHAAMTGLQSEIAALTNFQATLQSNINVLQQSLHRADTVIADAQVRISQPHPATGLRPSSPEPGSSAAAAKTNGNSGLPPIDDVLVAPTVVGKQLYDLVADERGIQQAIYALQAALVKGVIGVDTWSRHTRSLAREAFIKRALSRKIGRGMGLDVGGG